MVDVAKETTDTLRGIAGQPSVPERLLRMRFEILKVRVGLGSGAPRRRTSAC